jgi:hypothetical protein
VKRRRKEKPEMDGEPDVNEKLRVRLMQTGTDKHTRNGGEKKNQ